MINWKFFWIIIVLLIIIPDISKGQGALSQSTLDEIYERERHELSDTIRIVYEAVKYRGNSDFYEKIGDGDVGRGQDRAGMVEMLNRQLLRYTSVGDTLYIPNIWDADWKYYAPYPRYYESGQDKILIVHIPTQSWAAYEDGEIARWGWVATGKASTATPTGRMNVNWKAYYRLSNAAPPGQTWELYYVTNVHAAEGIHTHKYVVPIRGFASHGCIRMLEQDAKWVWNWTDKWIINYQEYVPRKQGTMVLVLGDLIRSKPVIFDFYEHVGAIQYHVQLPDDPYDISPGSHQQRLFDAMNNQLDQWNPQMGREALINSSNA